MYGSSASSPSAAYADLKLDSEGTGNSSGTENAHRVRRRSSLTNKDLTNFSNLVARSASPATKRSAATMEDDTMPDAPTESKLREIESMHASIEPKGDTAMFNPSNHESSEVFARSHTRAQSVDMLEGSSIVLSPDAEAAHASMPEKKPLRTGACKTPLDSESTKGSSIDAQGTLTHPSMANMETAETPPLEEQISIVMNMMQKPLEEGSQGYVVSQKWLGRVLSRGSDKKYEKHFAKEAQEGPIGPVDNSDLNLVMDTSMAALKDEAGEKFVPLRPGLSELEDFQILPKEAWDLILRWYENAKGSPVLVRYCHSTSDNQESPNYQYELYPPIFTILKLPDRTADITQSSLREKDSPPAQILASIHTNFNIFLRRLKDHAKVPASTKVRLWRILDGLDSVSEGGMITPAQSRSNSPSSNEAITMKPARRLVIDVNEFQKLESGSQKELINVGDNTNNPNYNGSATLNTLGLGSDSVLLLEEQIGGPAGGEFVSDVAERQNHIDGTPSSLTGNSGTVGQNSLKAKIAGSGRLSPVDGGTSIMTRGRSGRAGRSKGTVGLSNLGNTCYMNSALQCVRSIEELTEYFLRNKFKSELNPRNPLSHGGNVAKAYAALLHEMYINSSSSFAPRQFKTTIGRYGLSFSGYGQQDSQEFLLFLLDGLQEDLNRIHNKPYVEYRDSTDEMVHDAVALKELADDRWNKYKLRNDSVITDLFAGMYKSTVNCPVCDKVSIIFDPFNNLTLQIPIESCWTRLIYYYPLRSRPVRVQVDINKNATFWQLKEYVGKKMGVSPKKLVVSETFKSRFYKMFDDKATISEDRIADNDEVSVFEIEDEPTNYPAPQKKKKKSAFMGFSSSEDDDIVGADPSLSEKLLVPVYLREAATSRYESQRLFGQPFYIVVNGDEAKDYDAILRKILSKVDTLTTRDFLRESEEVSTDESDMGLMTHEEATSSASSGVAARSVEGEDGMVDISMREGHEIPGENMSAPRISHPPSASTSKPSSLPRMLRPGEFITPEVRNLFEMRYFTSTTEVIPTGWKQITDDIKDYPTLRSRQPDLDKRQASRKLNLRQRIRGGGTPSSSDEDEEENDVPELEPDEPDDSDDGLPPVEQLAQPRAFPSFGRSNEVANHGRRRLTIYSRKGKQAFKQNQFGGGRLSDEGPSLIRLGEAIILEWAPHGFDALFGRDHSDENNMRGANTWDSMPTLDDPAVRERRAKREKRRREGVSLDDCLDEFGKAEVLSESEAWFCPRCKAHRQASKRFQIWKAPDILVVHLKRFSTQGRFRDKLDVLVDFPIEGLDLSERVLAPEEGKSLVYDLFAVDNHYGGLGGGHYTACAKNFKDGVWYDYNGKIIPKSCPLTFVTHGSPDSHVTSRPSPENSIITSAAYLLFYRRRTTPPDIHLGGPFFNQLFSTEPNNQNTSSESDSRQVSPSGEGRLVDNFSRNGSSSGFRGVGPARQAGDGGLGGAARSDNEELPEYEEHAPGLQVVNPSHGMDIDEGIGDVEDNTQRFDTGGRSLGNYHRDTPSWSFENLDNDDDNTQFIDSYPSGAAGPSSMRGVSKPLNQHEAMNRGGGFDEDENLFDDDNASVGRAASSRSDDGPGLGDASDDEGEVRGQRLTFGSMPERGNSPAGDEHVPFMVDGKGLGHNGEGGGEEDNVVDIRIEEGDGA